MRIYAGIDEAGYGPMLGPLCVAATAFVLPDAAPGDDVPDLWKTLSDAVCTDKRDTRRRLAVDDSKKLKGANSAKTHPLLHLERGVLSFASATAIGWPKDDAALFRALATVVPDEPWMESTTALPVAHTADELRLHGGRLERCLRDSGVGIGLMRCETISPGIFNAQVDRLGSKAVVNMGAVLRLVESIRRMWPNADATIVVDRQSGRMRYYDEIRAGWPESRIQVKSETPVESRYRVEIGSQTMEMRFLKEAEASHLPVALASMTAKYVRELSMMRLNRFFQGQLPDLAPTAGYVTDARRYLSEIEPVLRSFGIERKKLARTV
jgi:ribonuclease HII